MPWVKAAELLPPENEPIHVYDNVNNQMKSGRYAAGRWYVEDVRDGRLREITGVTHWAPVLDSEINDDSDDD